MGNFAEQVVNMSDQEINQALSQQMHLTLFLKALNIHPSLGSYRLTLTRTQEETLSHKCGTIDIICM